MQIININPSKIFSTFLISSRELKALKYVDQTTFYQFLLAFIEISDINMLKSLSKERLNFFSKKKILKEGLSSFSFYI